MTRRPATIRPLVGALLVLLGSCVEPGPAQPALETDTGDPPAGDRDSDRLPSFEEIRERLAEAFPDAPEGADVYVGESPDEWGGISRFVLDEDGTFELQYLRAGASDGFVWPGVHSRSGKVVTFDFDLWSMAGPTLATGALDEDDARLKVEYNIVMWLTDFRGGWFASDFGD